MASSTHAGALQLRKADKNKSDGAIARLVHALGFGTSEAASQPDILDLLQTEHREVQSLLDQILGATTAARRSQLFRKFKVALVKHARAEESIVYDRLIALSDKGSRLAGHEGNVEHELADALIARAMKIRNKMSPEWTATVKVLREMLNHHIKEEESEIFSELRDHFKPDERRRMGASFIEEKKTVHA